MLGLVTGVVGECVNFSAKLHEQFSKMIVRLKVRTPLLLLANQILKFICREFIPVKNLVSALYFSYVATRKATLNTHSYE